MTGQRPLRIAIIDHLSAGGVSRFARALVTTLAARDDVAGVTYLVSASNVRRDGLSAAWVDAPKVTLRAIDGPVGAQDAGPHRGRAARDLIVRALGRAPSIYRSTQAAYRTVRRRVVKENPPWYEYRLAEDDVRSLDEHDVVFLAWPFYIEPFRPAGALVATFHDFHFRLFPEAYQAIQLELIDTQTDLWMRTCDVRVFSTRFMRGEAERLYPTVETSSVVVPLAPYVGANTGGATDSARMRALGIRPPYISFGGGRSAHKNILGLVRACALLREREIDIQLVITGLGTEVIGSDSLPSDDPAWPVREEMRTRGLVAGREILPLGYVADADVDAITRNAALVVSASLYEAGCGPALDAWTLGTPVAFSRIPPFVEQLELLGVEALTFDPRDPADIASTVEHALAHPDEMRAMAGRSREAIARHTWAEVADGYVAAFREAMERRAGGRAERGGSRTR
jgi:glycosyltransferase involved in cell wall biosynthesis